MLPSTQLAVALLRRRRGTFKGRDPLLAGISTHAWSRVGRDDEGNDIEESEVPAIATGILIVAAVVVVGRWFWIRNVG